MLNKNNKNLIVAFVTWFFVILAIRFVGLLQGVPFIYENIAVITAVLLLYPPVFISILTKRPILYWRFEKKVLLCDLKYFVYVSVLVFPISFVINHFYQKIIWAQTYHGGGSEIWGLYILTQILLVAFPEEFFFRGYLQDSLSGIFVSKKKIFGASFGWCHVIVSVVFALSHSLITLQWWHGFIFFPALVFSWLREKTGTIWAAIAFHAACNLFSYWIVLHY